MDAPASRSPTVYTLGSSTRSLEEFLEILRAYGIQGVVDVRRFPASRRFAHFTQANLKPSMERAGIRYTYLGQELGGHRKEGYEAYTRTPRFLEGIARLEAVACKRPTAFFCAERFPWKCHRRFIARVLSQRGWRVVHLLEKDRTWEPRE